MSQVKARIFLKPKTAKLKVRNPASGKHLIKTGEWVENNVYWYRRLNDGDVVETEPLKKTAKKKVAKKKAIKKIKE